MIKAYYSTYAKQHTIFQKKVVRIELKVSEIMKF